MKFLCKREPLAAGFRTVIGLCSSKSGGAGSLGVLLEAKDDVLKVSSSDGEVTAIYSIHDVKTEVPGTVLTDKVSGSLVMEMRDENLTCETDEKASILKILSEGKLYEVPTFDWNEFRGLQWEETDNVLVIGQETFRNAIQRTAFSVAKEGARYAFHAFLLDVRDDGEVYLVGSDGRRLSIVKVSTEEQPKFTGQYFIPKRAFTEFSRVQAPEGEPVKLFLSESKMCMKIGNTQVIAQLIEGKYPNYWAVIPKELKNEAVIPTKQFEDSIHRINLISDTDAPIAKLVFYSHGELEIRSAMENRSGKESIEVKLEGEGGEINFNPVFILEFLKSVDREVVTLGFTNNEIPGKFQGGEDFTYIVMPITV